MNRTRRKSLQSALSHMDEALRIIDQVEDEESEVLLNIPDNLQDKNTSSFNRNHFMTLLNETKKLRKIRQSIQDIVDGKK